MSQSTIAISKNMYLCPIRTLHNIKIANRSMKRYLMLLAGLFWLVTAQAQTPDVSKIKVEQLRSEEHTSELQSLMRISYAVFCLKKKTKNTSPVKHKSPKHSTQRM